MDEWKNCSRLSFKLPPSPLCNLQPYTKILFTPFLSLGITLSTTTHGGRSNSFLLRALLAYPGSLPLPTYADVVITGSGTAFVCTLLDVTWQRRASVARWIHMMSFLTKTYLKAPGRSWSAIWRSCRTGRVTGVQQRGRRGYSSQTGCAGSSWGGTSMSAGHRNPIAAAQDVLDVPAVHTHSSPSMTTSSTHPATISAPNMSTTLPIDRHPTSSRRCGKRSFLYQAI